MRKGIRIVLQMAAVLLIFALLMLLRRMLAAPPKEVPGLTGHERVLLRIWAVDAPGGGQAWLNTQLRAWEKQTPGVRTYLRQVSADELYAEDAVLPDVVLYMPGNVQLPDQLFLPLTGEAAESGILREPLLRCGRYRQAQYGLPLCWGAWGLAISGEAEPESAATPAPTTLLGRPAESDAPQATQEPGYPLAAAAQADRALQSPPGIALLTLGMMLSPDERPPLPEDFAHLSSADVYALFRRGGVATAMLTTGQITALNELAANGQAQPFRVMLGDEIITDQVWLASVTPDAPKEAAHLLAFLTGEKAQRALAAQGLYPARQDLLLYPSGVGARIENAALHRLTAINAYLAVEDVSSAAWQVWQGALTPQQALPPLV